MPAMIIAGDTRFAKKSDNSSSVRQRNGADDEEKVDRHVGENHERNEWDHAPIENKTSRR